MDVTRQSLLLGYLLLLLRRSRRVVLVLWWRCLPRYVSARTRLTVVVSAIVVLDNNVCERGVR